MSKRLGEGERGRTREGMDGERARKEGRKGWR